MMMKNYKITLSGLMLLLLMACSDANVDFGEQYKKTLYIVKSRDMLYSEECKFGEEKNSISFAVYCAGTEPIKSDITVKLRVVPEALDSLNRMRALGNPLYVDKVLLPDANYTLEDPTVTIKAGHQYAVLNVPFKSTGLDPDKQYVLPLKIVSNSGNFDVNRELNTMIYEIKMINGYSGEFSGSSMELPKTIRSVQPILKAMSESVLRMPIHTLQSDVTFLQTNFMLLTVANDSTTVTITPWKDSNVRDLGGSTYDRVKRRFDLHYTFTDGDGDELTIYEKIVNLNAPKEDEENSASKN